jgi:hypothetical protein
MLFFGVVFIYSLNGTTALSGDTLSARFLPLSLLREFDFDLDEFPFLYEPTIPYFLQQINGHIVSAYPPWAALLALPVYVLPVFGGLTADSHLVPELEKVAATLITALSVVILFCAIKRMTRENMAWGIAVVYAFGTSSFSTSSQALFQHGPSQLFLCLMLYWLIRGLEEPRYSAYAGFAMAGAIICRPLNVLIALPVGAYMLQKRRAHFVGFIMASLPPCLLYMVYNIQYFGHPLTTGFAATTMSLSSFLGAQSYILSTPFPEGLLGVLASPSRGLLIYSPILAMSFVGMVMVRRGSGHALLRYLSLAPFLPIILAAKYIMWWGGHSYGPRLLADITPILCLYLYPPFEWSAVRRLTKFALICLCGLSISTHALGAFSDGSWNYTPANVDQAPERLWSWVDSPPIYYSAEMVAKIRQAFAHLQKIVMASTSLDPPLQLEVAYDLISPGPGSAVNLNQLLILQVSTHNIGKAVWLARARTKDENGAVCLVWRWFKADQEVAASWGREFIKDDVLPGHRYEFAARTIPPREPGDYLLEIGLVRGSLTSFTGAGVAPLKIPLRVLGHSHGGDSNELGT